AGIEWRRGPMGMGIGPHLAYRARTGFTYDASGRMTRARSIHYFSADATTGELFSDRSYTYAAGRLLRETEKGEWGKSVAYYYDAAGRLIRKTSDRQPVTFRYYPNGLLHTKTERQLFGGGQYSGTVYTYTWKVGDNKSPR
ncbi:MAG: hypothetical protein EOO16_23445, partial [Chitinophagaceae bacterium]